MASHSEIDALVQLLDQQIVLGSKHVNITCDDPNHIEIEKTTVVANMDCDSGDTACKIPNLHLGDEEE